MNSTKVRIVLLALAAMVAPARAQQETQIQLDGKNYAVTEFPQGRFAPTHMVSISGPEGQAMVSVDKKGKITAVLSPPGGQLNGVDYRPVINHVWEAYQAQKNGNATNSGQPAPSNDTNDPNGTLRAQAEALQQQALQRAALVTGQQSGQPAKLIADFPAGGGAVVHGTPYGDIVFNKDATEAHFTRTSSNALSGNTEQTWEYDYVGKKDAAGALATGVGGALAGAFDVRHAGRIDGGGIHVLVETNGGKPHEVYGTEQKTFAVNPSVRNPLDNGERQLAVNFLDAAKQALQTASDAAKIQKVETFRPDPEVFTELFDKWKHKL